MLYHTVANSSKACWIRICPPSPKNEKSRGTTGPSWTDLTFSTHLSNPLPKPRWRWRRQQCVGPSTCHDTGAPRHFELPESTMDTNVPGRLARLSQASIHLHSPAQPPSGRPFAQRPPRLSRKGASTTEGEQQGGWGGWDSRWVFRHLPLEGQQITDVLVVQPLHFEMQVHVVGALAQPLLLVL